MNNLSTPLSKISSKYDAVIIGAGIGGLVCGCYLAKAGMKVLIVEKNRNVGGYCTSFKRGGFTFDTTIRGLVGCAPNGMFGNIVNELKINKFIRIRRAPIFDIIRALDFEVFVSNDSQNTILQIQELFPREARNIQKLFSKILTRDFVLNNSIFMNCTFQNVLDEYFTDRKLKFLFSVMRSDSGLHPSMTSAISDLALLRGYTSDGGYYPDGGMQCLSDAFAMRFKELGGSLITSSEVTSIKMAGNRSTGVVINSNICIRAEHIVSNSDATRTLKELIANVSVRDYYSGILKNMKPSVSVFIVYLGLKRSLKQDLPYCCSLWQFPKYLIKKDYNFSEKIDLSLGCVICAFPSFHNYGVKNNGESVFFYIGAPYKDDAFWSKNHEVLSQNLVKRFATIFPDIEKDIVVQEYASPQTLYKYTYNMNGASKGWSPILPQTTHSLLPIETVVENLYLVGHWTTSLIGQGGVSLVAYTGKHAARIILRERKSRINA